MVELPKVFHSLPSKEMTFLFFIGIPGAQGGFFAAEAKQESSADEADEAAQAQRLRIGHLSDKSGIASPVMHTHTHTHKHYFYDAPKLAKQGTLITKSCSKLT